MSVIPWEDVEKRIREFKEDMNNKKKLFDGYDNLLDKSIQSSALALPRPLDLIVKDLLVDSTYKNHKEDQLIDKIRAIEEIIENISIRGHHYYMNPRFQDILKRMHNSSSNVTQQLKKMQQILVSDDDNSAFRLITELENELKQADQSRNLNNNHDKSTLHKKEQIEVFKRQMEKRHNIIRDSFSLLNDVVSSVEVAQRRLELREQSQQMYNDYKFLKDQLNVDMTEYDHIRVMYLAVEDRFPDPKGE